MTTKPVEPRTYGPMPVEVAMLHGGPGAPGYMAPVARELSKSVGVLEPFQASDCLEGQIEELHDLLTHYPSITTLVGSSWGAVLALFVAARRNTSVRKLILVGSAVFDASNSERIKKIRFERMSNEDRQRELSLNESFNEHPDKDLAFRQLADCSFDSDVYDPITRDLEIVEYQYLINQKVWTDFERLRDAGELAAEFSKIEIPVSIIHGDYDPHPLEGIEPFLRAHLAEVDVHLLEKCGHYPWIERYARDAFFGILRNEVAHPT